MKFFIKSAEENFKKFNKQVSGIGNKNNTAVLCVLSITFDDRPDSCETMTSISNLRTKLRTDKTIKLIDRISIEKKREYLREFGRMLNILD